MSLFTVPQGSVESHGLQLDIAGVSEQGPRPENQDAFSIESFTQTGLVAVADGMGGEKGGRLAADTALRALVEVGPIRSLNDARRAVRLADAQVTEVATEDPQQRSGMGCALGLLALTEAQGDGVKWIGAHVGDVRILSRSPDGAVRLETRDHTPAFARYEAGEIGIDEIPDTAGANRLQRAVGRGGEADVTWLPARPGWTWLIISDGVYKAMRLDELGTAMAASSAAAGCELIRSKVEERGPDDNYTAVLVRAVGPGAPAPITSERTDPMETSKPAPARSGWSVATLLLSIVALAAAGFALWTSLQLRTLAAERTQTVEQLRAQLDSLRSQLSELSDPFGPTAAPLRQDTAALRPAPSRNPQ